MSAWVRAAPSSVMQFHSSVIKILVYKTNYTNMMYTYVNTVSLQQTDNGAPPAGGRSP